MIRWLVLLTALLTALLMFGPNNARADELRPGYIELTERTEGVWSLGWKHTLAQQGPPPQIAPGLPDNCEAAGPIRRRTVPGAVLGSVELDCKGSLVGQPLDAAALLENGEVIARIVPLEEAAQTFRLTASQPAARLAAASERPPVWRSYIALGVEHILAGWDHLLFVIALVLLVARWRAVAWAVTAFTAAHSITLAGTTLGLVGLPGRAVEAVIALSILLLAVEIARRREASLTFRYPWAVAFGFGLIHGFGFAGALREIGLPEGEVWQALLAFNIGVEAGQLLVVAGVLALRWLVMRLAPQADAPALNLASYAIGITGAYWLIDRLVG